MRLSLYNDPFSCVFNVSFLKNVNRRMFITYSCRDARVIVPASFVQGSMSVCVYGTLRYHIADDEDTLCQFDKFWVTITRVRWWSGGSIVACWYQVPSQLGDKMLHHSSLSCDLFFSLKNPLSRYEEKWRIMCTWFQRALNVAILCEDSIIIYWFTWLLHKDYVLNI
jgi:hypothetical protein